MWSGHDGKQKRNPPRLVQVVEPHSLLSQPGANALQGSCEIVTAKIRGVKYEICSMDHNLLADAGVSFSEHLHADKSLKKITGFVERDGTSLHFRLNGSVKGADRHAVSSSARMHTC